LYNLNDSWAEEARVPNVGGTQQRTLPIALPNFRPGLGDHRQSVDFAECDGGVRSQIRTGLDLKLPDKWLFTGYFRGLLPVIGNST
jgi:hypothetical protein